MYMLLSRLVVSQELRRQTWKAFPEFLESLDIGYSGR